MGVVWQAKNALRTTARVLPRHHGTCHGPPNSTDQRILPMSQTVITKGSRAGPEFLAFDEAGNHRWTVERLDAIRFGSEDEARDGCSATVFTPGVRFQKVDRWDGHYEAFRNHEIQVFRDNLKGKPGGKRWRFRVAPLGTMRGHIYSPGYRGFTTPQAALRAAKVMVATRMLISA